ncbi:MAG: hypothetical protein CMP78_01650 [Formosa sp.]|nr:hypothetical protein [Formosa sp.]|tara:strand:- start:517 stop:2058 length:1542 start_codon:yes stop_codon:yes gene_type:complete
MKKFKLLIFSILMVLTVLMSCTNEEVVIDNQQNTEESESIVTTLNRLNNQFDENGNVDEAENPAGNIVFDFCFNFVYPIDLSFNTGTTVTVNSLDELIDIYSASTENLFIDGIAFPFQVETYNENSNALEIETINSEDEFLSLLEDCGFEDVVEDCICTQEYDPVCIDITDLDGELFTISYPNACYAICDGFTEDDFNEECQQGYESGANECFEFVYPISITLDEEDALTVNSREELFNAIYGAYHIGLVFPLDIITNDDNTVLAITINSYDELEAIIENCFDDDYVVVDCSIGDITNTLADYCWSIDFTDDNEFIYNLNSDGTYQLQDIGGNLGGSVLTSGAWSIVAGNNTYYITLSAELADYNDEWVVTDCNTDLGYAYLEMQSIVYPQAYIYYIDCNDDGNDDNNYDCSSEEGTSNILTECPWIIDFIDSNEFIYFFYIDGTFQVISENNVLTTGEWEIGMTNNGYLIELDAESPNFDDTWAINDCDEEMGLALVSINYPQAEIYSINCD